MDDFSSMSGTEMFARRDAAESEISGLIGQFVFTYSRFITALHLCVAWHNQGKDLDSYPSIAEDLAAADLLRRIEKQARDKLGSTSLAFKAYKSWLRRAHQIRETRNTVMHSRWSIEAFGRHAIAVTTPVFVEPVKEVIFSADQLRQVCQTCEKLMGELNGLRDKHPL
ncbi:hypothetical protein N800_11155 [Lysobacter daejeonensis GH1-9]|uniref:Uncharacterized protein n=1 Tax=Lysobacter daejeonensis GH1-9 TaxID=1385517 RepID=A0A0A0ER14_9GAMM|nr:hypothetical protein [Lysobacter daejeonensis]KGM52665.1 hypothetical protein N800_11155 [Lysobacter daejeonensis GH1-9]